jgi:serpin B
MSWRSRSRWVWVPVLVGTMTAWAALSRGQETGEGGAAATDEELAEVVAGNTDFAFALYDRLAAAPGNLFFSPYSLSTALGMTYGGARGGTAEEMAATLRFGLAQERLHPAFHRLANELARRSEGQRPGEEGDRFELTVANALWPQQDFLFLDAFMAQMRDFYGAEPRALDYVNDADGATDTINGWVAERTNDRIPQLIPRGLLTPETRLVLTNAIYFNASWATPFPEESTIDGTFHAPDGEVTVPLMRGRRTAGSWLGEGLTIVDVPYLGEQTSLLIVMPEAGGMAELERSLSRERLGGWVAGLRHGEVDLTMPRFESGSQVELSEVLSAMGMPGAFLDAYADFSGMTGRRDLRIDKVIHEANITLDETGTEAAAATAVVMVRITSAGPDPEPVRIVIDRPFVYLVRDRVTGSVLFMGRMLQP